MLLNQPPKIKKWLLGVMGLFIFLMTTFWASSHVFIPGLIKKSAAEYGDKLGYQITYRDLSLSPLSLRLEIDGLSLGKADENKLLEFKRLVIALRWTKLLVGEVGFDEIVLDQPSLLIEKRLGITHGVKRSGHWNWQEFIHALEKSFPPKEANSSNESIKFSVEKLLVNAGALSLIDESSGLKESLKPFSIKLLQVANYDKNGLVSGVRGQYDLNLGSLQLSLPGLNKALAFRRVTIGGGLDNPSPNKLGLALNLQIDEGTVRSHWDFNTASKALEGAITIENIATAPLITVMPANKELLGTGGLMNANLAVKLSGDTELISGDLHLLNVSVIEKGEKAPLASWEKAEIRQFEFKSTKQAGVQKSALLMDGLTIDRPALRFEINEQGLSNFRRLFSKSQAIKTDNTSPSQPQPNAVANTPGEVQKNNGHFELDIRTVNLRQGEVHFTDMAMRPHFKVDIQKFNATFLGVTNVPGRSASIAMDGVVAGSGSMRAKGQTSFDDPRRNHDILMSFRNLPLTTFNPAVMTYAGYQITGGNLNLNLNYRAKDGQLNGSNQIIIKKVQLGDEVPDYQGKKLPLGLAIALLEDSDDTIDVTIRIAGNIDSPEFSATGLVWQAITTVIGNVATAPFRAIAAVLGMEGESAVNAVPGEVVYLPGDQERLEKFGDYLLKRPNSNLIIIGTYDPVQDKQELARARADAAILSEAGFKLVANEPVPIPVLSDPRIQSGLKAAYAQYIGRIRLGQRLLMLPDGESRNEQLRSELIAGIEITEDELKQLASRRAQLANEIMMKSAPELRDRIQLGDTKAATANKEGIPLDVEVRIK